MLKYQATINSMCIRDHECVNYLDTFLAFFAPCADEGFGQRPSTGNRLNGCKGSNGEVEAQPPRMTVDEVAQPVRSARKSQQLIGAMCHSGREIMRTACHRRHASWIDFMEHRSSALLRPLRRRQADDRPAGRKWSEIKEQLGFGGVQWGRNGLELVGKGASDGGSVGVDRSDCVLYPPYTFG